MKSLLFLLILFFLILSCDNDPEKNQLIEAEIDGQIYSFNGPLPPALCHKKRSPEENQQNSRGQGQGDPPFSTEHIRHENKCSDMCLKGLRLTIFTS